MLAISAVLFAGLASCTSDDDKLAAVKAAGQLTVLTYNGTTTYYEGAEGPTGFEYDLVKAFADELGVSLRVIVVEKSSDIIRRLFRGEADFAAAGVIATPARSQQVNFTSPYHNARMQVIYRLGTRRPISVADLIGREIEVATGTNYVDRLNELKQQFPELKWIESDDKRTEDLLQMVWEGLLEFTIADSNVVALNSQYFPELQVAFNLERPEPVVWAFPAGNDNSLYDAAEKYLKKSRANGTLAQVIDRYYGPISGSNFINLSVYQLRIQNRLPQYQVLFQEAAKKHELDWRLLAAMAYQESYWDPKMVSHTGVRGFMMLTQQTALQLGVDRLDPAHSVEGGARYLRQLSDRLPADMASQDRLWMALAAYNVGPYHLEDARILTQQQGGDPNKWNDVKERLPLLAIPKWYTKAKFGFCRGVEPVRFVNRVRAYYDILVKLDDEDKAKRTTDALKLKALAI